MFFPPTIAAEIPSPDGIKLLDERINEGGGVGQNAVLKVAFSLGLCPHACTSEVRASKVCLHFIYDDTLEMDTRTKHSLHRRSKRRIAIEVVPLVRSWVFRMNEPHLNPALHQPVQHLQKRHHIAPTRIGIHVFDVRSAPCGPYGVRALRSGNPTPLARANVAIHSRSVTCDTIPQMTEVLMSRLERKVVMKYHPHHKNFSLTYRLPPVSSCGIEEDCSPLPDRIATFCRPNS